MKEIKIKYTFLKWFTRAITVQCPTSWAKMNGKQFQLMARLQYEQMGDIDLIAVYYALPVRIVRMLDKYELYILSNLIDVKGMAETSINHFIINQLSGTDLLAPQPQLRGVTMTQFVLFDTLFFDYLNKKNENDLIKMIAMLYMKKGEFTHTIDINSRVNYIRKKVDIASLNAVLLNYIFIRRWLSKAYPHVFSFGHEKERKKNDISTKKQPNRPDWITIMDDFAGDNVLQIDDYFNMRATDIFRIMNRKISNYYKHGLRK